MTLMIISSREYLVINKQCWDSLISNWAATVNCKNNFTTRTAWLASDQGRKYTVIYCDYWKESSWINTVGCKKAQPLQCPCETVNFMMDPSVLGVHWIKSLMTCYMAAKRRWITRSKQMLPPHTGPSENNVILKDQLKCAQRQTQTKHRLTHTDLNILHGRAPCL